MRENSHDMDIYAMIETRIRYNFPDILINSFRCDSPWTNKHGNNKHTSCLLRNFLINTRIYFDCGAKF